MADLDLDGIRRRLTVDTPQPWRSDIAALIGEVERLRAQVASTGSVDVRAEPASADASWAPIG